MIEFKKIISSKRIGRIQQVKAISSSFLPDWRPGTDYRKTVSAQKKLGGGVLLEISHEIDYLCWLFGSPKIIKSNVQKLSNFDIDVEDSAFIVFQFSDKAGSFNCELSLDFISNKSKRECKVIGQKGVLIWDGIKNSLIYNDYESDTNDQIIKAKEYDLNHMYYEQMEDFLKLLKGQSASVKGILEAKETVEIILDLKSRTRY